VYGDIQDRFFGGINLFVDDVGLSMASTYKGHYGQRYREIFLSGTSNRPAGKTNFNGLKLIADQIANNNDILWLHDDRFWVNCAFWENSSIFHYDESVKEDRSIKAEEDKKYYAHIPLMGVTYDIKINLAKNSVAKKKAYESYGQKIDLELAEIHEIYSKYTKGITDSSIINIDLLDSRNYTKSFINILSEPFQFLLFRNRAVRKNKQIIELRRLFIETSKNNTEQRPTFEELVIYDLNQTTLFQMREAIESIEITELLNKSQCKRVVLISEECWIFVLELNGARFSLNKKKAIDYLQENKEQLKQYFRYMITNANKTINNILNKNKNKFIVMGKIEWEGIEINHYINTEEILNDRACFNLIFKEVLRLSGLLNDSQRIVFIEDFMKEFFNELDSQKFY